MGANSRWIGFAGFGFGGRGGRVGMGFCGDEIQILGIRDGGIDRIWFWGWVCVGRKWIR